MLWQSDEIAAAAQALELIETLGWFLPLLALILIGLAIWVSPDRRRTIRLWVSARRSRFS